MFFKNTNNLFIFQCCAVSFIENLTAESLNMQEDEFRQYMDGKILPSSTWDSALVMCEVEILNSFFCRLFNKCVQFYRKTLLNYNEKLSAISEIVLFENLLLIRVLSVSFTVDSENVLKQILIGFCEH